MSQYFQLVPIAAFWAGANCLLSAARLINGLRDSVIQQKINKEPLGAAHAVILRLDYLLVLLAAVSASFLFSGVLFWAGVESSIGNAKGVALVWFFASGVNVLFGVGFIVCGVLDLREMNKSILELRSDTLSVRPAGISKSPLSG